MQTNAGGADVLQALDLPQQPCTLALPPAYVGLPLSPVRLRNKVGFIN